MTVQLALTATVNHFMQEFNLSLSEVASRSGLNVSTVRRVIQGTGKYTTPATALKLVQSISVPPEQFYAVLEGYRADLPMQKLLN